MSARWQWLACWVGVSVVSFLDAGCGSGDTSGARSGVGGAAAAGAPSGGDSGGAESGAAAGTEEGGGGEVDVGGAGAAGSEACEVGEERCDCYPNQTCNGALRCLSGLCVADVAATGGAAGAGGGATGGEPPEGGAAGSTAPQGGTEPSGGATSGGSAAGGAAGAPGGVATGGASGGTTSDGGSAAGGAAGATGGTATGGAGGDAPGGTGGAATGGAATGGAATGGATTGGTGGGTGGATSCFSAPDGYVDYGGILGYSWGYRVVDAIGENANLRADTLALDYTLPGASYDELALIGFNLNQPTVPGDDPAYGHDVADEVGICVHGTGFDRIAVEDDSGGYWCVEHSGCATWDEFTETCWEPGPALPANAVIYKAAAIAPIRTLEEQTSTICITNLYLWDGT